MIKVGQRLYQERINKNLTIEQVSKETKIRQNFLTAIENGDYNSLPSFTYAQGFVSNYAQFLNLPKKEILALFRREFDEKKYTKVLPDNMTGAKTSFIPKIYFHQAFIAFLLGMTIFIGYLGFQLRYMFIPPPLTVESPPADSETPQNLKVIGNTDPNATVYINNEPVSINAGGDFSKSIFLFPGKNTITVKSVNRFGKETILERTVLTK